MKSFKKNSIMINDLKNYANTAFFTHVCLVYLKFWDKMQYPIMFTSVLYKSRKCYWPLFHFFPLKHHYSIFFHSPKYQDNEQDFWNSSSVTFYYLWQNALMQKIKKMHYEFPEKEKEGRTVTRLILLEPLLA